MAIISPQLQKGKYMIFVVQYRWKKNEKISGDAML
jgi:hypothetical protein